MKLLTKLTIFITGSKMLIVILFVALLPLLVSKVSFQYTNYYLKQQQKKVLSVIGKNGISYYLQGDSTYGSYTMLREEYISLYPAAGYHTPDTIVTDNRIIEDDTLNYRILTYNIKTGNAKYVLEIGKTTATIGEYNTLLQRFTLYVLMVLIALSIIIDLLYTWILLRPLNKIVQTKLTGHKFPFRETLVPVKTSTADFRVLDQSFISLMEKIHEAFDKEREFTSNASHELMTPIGILQTHAENLLMDESLGEAQQEKLASMMKTLARLKKIVHSLLFISRIENEQFAKKDTVNLQLLVNEVMEELGHRLEPSNISFVNKLPSDLLLQNVNRDLLFQLFFNLINNAIRYNKTNGSITISVQLGNVNHPCIFISDTGTGIKEEDQPHIFNRFKRSGHTDGEGYGLGLAIVKSIVEYHSATITLSSIPEKGTTISLQF